MKYYLLCICGLLLGTSAHASLALNLDTTSETLWLSGSDTGNSETLGGFVEIASWAIGSSGTLETIDLSSTINESFNDNTQLGIRENAAGNAIRISFANSDFATFSPTPFTSVTGNSTPISYAGLSATHKTILEGFNGQSMPVSQGSGWSALQIIPEPSSLLSLAFGSALLYVWRRRKTC